MKLENPFLRRTSLTQSIADRNTYISRWGGFLIDPVAVRLGSRKPSAGLLLYHPEAPKADRRKVGFRMMFNGPQSMLYGSVVIAAVLLLVVFLAPLSYLVSLGLGLIAGLAAYGLLAVISARVAHRPWNAAVLWRPHHLGNHTSDPDLESLIATLSTLDNTASKVTTPEEYKRHWTDIYDQAVELNA